MTSTGASRPRGTDHDVPQQQRDSFGVALDGVTQSSRALTSASAARGCPDATRARGELESALSRAEVLANRLAAGPERTEALRQLAEPRTEALRALGIAEQQIGVGDPLACGSRSRLPAARRARRDTLPDSPRAFRDTRGDDEGGVATALSPGQSPISMAERDGSR